MNRKQRRARLARSAKGGIPGLCRRARGNRRIVPSCIAATSGTRPTESLLRDGWSLVLTCEAHDSIEHWHLSAKLHPQGRSSIEEDWRSLGKVILSVIAGSGAETEPPVEPVVPIEETHPNAALHWCWHSDRSPVEDDVMSMLRDAVRSIHLAAGETESSE